MKTADIRKDLKRRETSFECSHFLTIICKRCPYALSKGIECGFVYVRGEIDPIYCWDDFSRPDQEALEAMRIYWDEHTL